MNTQEDTQPTGIRDQLIGRAKFTERIYPYGISISTIANEVQDCFTKNEYERAGGIGSTVFRREAPDLIEVIINRPHGSDPFIVVIARLGDGFRVSFLRIRGLGKILKDGVGPIAATAFLVSAPLALFTAGIQAATAGLEGIFERQFWTYIEARIAELAPASPVAAPISASQNSTSEIERLWQLKQQGALTQEEFDMKKKELLRIP